MRSTLLVFALLALLACGGNPVPQEEEQGHERILSLSPHATQMLEAFGLMDQVVGVTDFCPLPPSRQQVPRVGGLMNPNVELMLSLRPTVAFHAPTARNLEDRLSDAGIRAVPLPNESLADIYTSLRLMGKELGREDRAEELVKSSQATLDQLASDLQGRPSLSVLFVIGHTPGSLRDIHAAGPDTFLDELIGFAGGINRMADSPTRYPQVSREVLIRNPPNVILMAPPVGGWTSEGKDFLRAAWHDLLGPAALNARVEFMEDASITIPGPYIHHSATKMAGLIHHGSPEE